jgi:molecular chaperone HtpG
LRAHLASETEIFAMTTTARPFEADVSKLLHMMVHSVYSDRDVFLRELISNAADACEKLRYEAIANPELLGEDPKLRIMIALDKEARRLTIEDNGIGMSESEMADALGTIARSGTKAFLDRIGQKEGAGGQLIGQFGVGFYSAFMVASQVDVTSRRAGSDEAAVWSSDGQGTFTVGPIETGEAPLRGTRVVLHLLEEQAGYAETYKIQEIIKAQSGHVPVPISLVTVGDDAAPEEIGDGAALWTRPKSEITSEAYTDFYRSVAGAYDEPALTVHMRAEGRHDYTLLAFVPTTPPFDLFDPDRRGRMKLYVRRVFITDEADIVPRYLRFVRGLVDSADIPLNMSREMIQDSPIMGAIRKAVSNRILSDLGKLADSDSEAYLKVWNAFGPVLKEGLYEDFERRDTLLGLARFRTTASGDQLRSMKDIAADFKDNQTAIYYATGTDLTRLKSSPQLEGFKARGIEVLLLTDQIDAFWVGAGPDYGGKPFKSVAQGAADLALIPLVEVKPDAASPEVSAAVDGLIARIKLALGEDVADVRASDRLTDSAACLVAPDTGMDREFERLLVRAGRLPTAAKPVLEINPRHDLVIALAATAEGDGALVEDAGRLLLDEAMIRDGDLPNDTKGFSDRLARVLARAVSARAI